MKFVIESTDKKFVHKLVDFLNDTNVEKGSTSVHLPGTDDSQKQQDIVIEELTTALQFIAYQSDRTDKLWAVELAKTTLCNLSLKLNPCKKYDPESEREL